MKFQIYHKTQCTRRVGIAQYKRFAWVDKRVRDDRDMRKEESSAIFSYLCLNSKVGSIIKISDIKFSSGLLNQDLASV